jgi:hypothetical protein
MMATHLKELMINDEGFAFDPRSGHTYNINATGLLVVNALKAGASHDEIIEQIVEFHEVDKQTADRDLEVFLRELQRQRLVDAEDAQ